MDVCDASFAPSINLSIIVSRLRRRHSASHVPNHCACLTGTYATWAAVRSISAMMRIACRERRDGIACKHHSGRRKFHSVEV